MPALEYHLGTAGDVTLVQLAVTADVPQQVRVANRLDGPVWPPRREGVPAAGWDETGYTGHVDPADRLVLGYASPAPPTEPPAELVPAESVAADTAAGAEGPSPAAILRTLGAPGPPRDAVPDRGSDDGPTATDGPTGTPADAGGSEHGASREAHRPERPVFAPWLAAVAARADRADRLAAASSVPEAREAVAEAGGVEAVGRLADALAADRRALDRVAREAGALADRLDRTEVPVETLARLA